MMKSYNDEFPVLFWYLVNTLKFIEEQTKYNSHATDMKS